MSFPKYPAYKPSGVPWLGDVPEHWEVKRLKYNLCLLTEKTNSRNNPVALENIESWSGRFISTETEFEGDGIAFERGDILFGKLRPYLAKALLADKAGEAVGDFHVMRPQAQIEPRFAQYAILNRSFIDMVDGSTFGSKMPRVSWEFLGNMLTPTPPLSEQSAIATFLTRETSKIDALVAEQQKLIALLKEKRQAVISHAVTKGLDPSVPMKDSGVEWLGEVPEHWDVVPMKRACGLLKDGTHLPPPRVDDGIPLLSVRNLQEGIFGLLDDDSFISEQSYNELCRGFIPQANDVLLAIVGATLGKTAVIPNNLGKFHIQRSLAIFRTLGILHPHWLWYLFQSKGFQALLWEYVGYSAQPGIYLGTLSEFKIPLPHLQEQENLLAYLSNETTKFDTLIAEAQSAIALLQERRTALISAAVTGKMDVRGIIAKEIDL
ncbi:MAG: restriction endonuclease subunit S [Leptothrix ochracea]|uniref:restriction endonuclease subunit S n=1 Tax=Leptothrix ochracea TaxID=735331 RepID=UPI0034E2DFC1